MDSTRRGFIGAAGFTVVASRLVRGTDANSAVRVGLLGCGGRGTVVADGMVKNAGARVVALGDLFQDQLDRARPHFSNPALVFRGPHAFQEMSASTEIDAIVIATPPYFHPQHLRAVVEAGKHAYCEKPVAVDVPGTRHVLESGRLAGGRLSLEVGFQIRSAPPFAELVRRIHAGALGEIGCGEAHYYCPYMDASHPDAPPAQMRLRNWLHDRVLSGDIIVEQNIHALDVCNWALQGHPVKAIGAGGRKGRPAAHDDCLGHCSVCFWYPGDVQVSFSSKQIGKGPFDVCEQFFGTRGSAQLPYSGALGVAGEESWIWPGSEKKTAAEFSVTGSFFDNLADADAEKHKRFIESITSGRFHNQASLGVESSLTAMLGRTAIYTGREVAWDELVRSEEVWDAGFDLDRTTALSS